MRIKYPCWAENMIRLVVETVDFYHPSCYDPQENVKLNVYNKEWWILWWDWLTSPGSRVYSENMNKKYF